MKTECNFNLGVRKVLDILVYVILGFHQRDILYNQQLNTDCFQRPAVSFAQCNIGTDKIPHAGITLISRQNKCSQRHSQFVCHLTKDDILQPYVSQQDFRPSNINNIDPNIGQKRDFIG